MEYLFIALLTTAISFVILIIIKKSENKFLNKVTYRQSDIHNFVKVFYKKNKKIQNKQSQMTNRLEQDAVKIVLTEDRAYWVADNIFYTANLVNDKPDMSTASPIDTSNLSKDDIDKMLFILDNLDRGNEDERGSTGN